MSVPAAGSQNLNFSDCRAAHRRWASSVRAAARNAPSLALRATTNSERQRGDRDVPLPALGFPCRLREEVVIAGGGVIPIDHRRRVEGERTQVEDAAPDAHAVAAAGPRGPALGLIEQDLAPLEREVRRAEGRGA